MEKDAAGQIARWAELDPGAILFEVNAVDLGGPAVGPDADTLPVQLREQAVREREAPIADARAVEATSGLMAPRWRMPGVVASVCLILMHRFYTVLA